MENKNSTVYKEVQKISPVDQVTLALARVQGGWDGSSRETLLRDSGIGRGMFDREGASRTEKMLADLLEKASLTFTGDGSIARTLLGHSIILNDEDRGLITLATLVNNGRFELEGDWITATLINADIVNGNSFKKIRSNLKSGLAKFSGILTFVLKTAKKVFPDEAIDNEEFESPLSKILDHLDSVYGGSDNALLKNKEVFKQEIYEKLSSDIDRLDRESLVQISDILKTETDDPVVGSSIGAAKGMLANILKFKKSVINDLLTSLDKD